MRKEKILECEECPFVTEYKHHMDYHNNNHSGCKPFRCSKCSYTCVNKVSDTRQSCVAPPTTLCKYVWFLF